MKCWINESKKSTAIENNRNCCEKKRLCSKCSTFLTNTKINKTAEATHDSVICCTILVVDEKIKQIRKKENLRCTQTQARVGYSRCLEGRCCFNVDNFCRKKKILYPIGISSHSRYWKFKLQERVHNNCESITHPMAIMHNSLFNRAVGFVLSCQLQRKEENLPQIANKFCFLSCVHYSSHRNDR